MKLRYLCYNIDGEMVAREKFKTEDLGNGKGNSARTQKKEKIASKTGNKILWVINPIFFSWVQLILTPLKEN